MLELQLAYERNKIIIDNKTLFRMIVTLIIYIYIYIYMIVNILISSLSVCVLAINTKMCRKKITNLIF